jgi:phosphoenolpyruvate carboxykinase (ATP)
MQDRLTNVLGLNTKQDGYDALPEDAAAAIQKVVDNANTL